MSEQPQGVFEEKMASVVKVGGVMKDTGRVMKTVMVQLAGKTYVNGIVLFLNDSLAR